MEKYRQWADGGTGINPFVPKWSHHKMSLPLRAVKLLVLFPVALARVVIFAAAIAWLAVAELLCALILLPILRYPVYQGLTYVGCGLALFALGVVPIGDSLADYRRLKVAPPKKGGAKVFDAGRGVLVLANQQGLTDVLYLGLRLCPTFVFPAKDGVPVRFSLLGALRRSSTRNANTPAPQPAKLNDIARWAKSGWRGPVVVFPEGTRTNGSGILTWNPQTFDGLGSYPPETALVSLEYSKTGAYTPHHTVGPASWHVLKLCYQPWHTVKSTWLPSAGTVTSIEGKPLAEQMASLRTVVSRMVHECSTVEVAADRHHEFMAYWDASQRKGYTQQQQQPKKKAA
mmetsp:Transcript_64106/g.180453  ORF Transcript_64106/g.180453 Transcript_64106/m.180453 type:complete len:343 (+) Transcript_64106:49-1077(+)